MFELVTGSRSRLCDRSSRRDFLRAGLFGSAAALVGGVRAADPSAAGPLARGKSVVFLFLAGGPSQFETFDPKPDGPEGCSSLNGHIATALPGVRFSAYLPKLAKLADRLTVVRSFQTKHPEHNGAHKQLMTADLSVQDGKPITEPGLGAVFARAAGAVNPDTGLPRHALVPPTTRTAKAKAGFNGSFESVVEGAQAAHLGTAFAPFEVLAPLSDGPAEEKKKGGRRKGDEPPDPLELYRAQLSPPQLDGRLDLLKQLDTLDRRADSLGGMGRLDTFTARAAELLRTGAVRKALDLSLERPETVRAYDTEHFPNWNCDDNSKFIRIGPSVGFSLGRQLLLARRLCEAGAGFVTVVNANWDFHARKGIPNMPEGMGVFAPPLDHAVTAFLDDLKARGLDEKILLVITGEFGRTPGLDKNLGRHHHAKLCPLVFAGGGLRHGQVVGGSDKRGGEPSGDPLSIADLHATLLHTLLDVSASRADAGVPKTVLDRATGGTPIKELFA